MSETRRAPSWPAAGAALRDVPERGPVEEGMTQTELELLQRRVSTECSAAFDEVDRLQGALATAERRRDRLRMYRDALLAATESWCDVPQKDASGAPPPERAPRPPPTHRCKVCGALWRLNEWPFDWTLYSAKAGECCDNVAMGEQIEPITGFRPLCDPGSMGEPPPASERAHGDGARAALSPGGDATDGGGT